MAFDDRDQELTFAGYVEACGRYPVCARGRRHRVDHADDDRGRGPQRAALRSTMSAVQNPILPVYGERAKCCLVLAQSHSDWLLVPPAGERGRTTRRCRFAAGRDRRPARADEVAAAVFAETHPVPAPARPAERRAKDALDLHDVGNDRHTSGACHGDAESIVASAQGMADRIGVRPTAAMIPITHIGGVADHHLYLG